MKASLLVCLLALVAIVSAAPQGPIPFHPVPGIPISNDNSKSKPIEDIKPIAATVPVTGVTPAESKPKEWLSSTPTVADRSRCLKDNRTKNFDAPPPSAAEIASPHQYPFVVAIFSISEETKKYNLECSGSLISPTKILTVAGCLINASYGILNHALESIKVRLGMHFLNETTNDAQVTRNVIKVRPRGSSYEDFLILTLDSPVEYTDTISPVCLVPDCFDDIGQSVIAMGWEFPPDDELKTKNTDFLGLVRLSTFPLTKCYAKDDQDNLDHDRWLCAHGDFSPYYSGGPVVIENHSRDDTSCRFMQVSVIGFFRAKTDMDSLVRVKNFLPWIEENSK